MGVPPPLVQWEGVAWRTEEQRAVGRPSSSLPNLAGGRGRDGGGWRRRPLALSPSSDSGRSRLAGGTPLLLPVRSKEEPRQWRTKEEREESRRLEGEGAAGGSGSKRFSFIR